MADAINAERDEAIECIMALVDATYVLNKPLQACIGRRALALARQNVRYAKHIDPLFRLFPVAIHAVGACGDDVQRLRACVDFHMLRVACATEALYALERECDADADADANASGGAGVPVVAPPAPSAPPLEHATTPRPAYGDRRTNRPSDQPPFAT